MIQPTICPNWNGYFDELTSEIAERPYWQYGRGEHSSERRKIIGSLLFSASTDSGSVVNNRHLIIYGSSKWIVGRNVTKKYNINHIDKNVLQLPNEKSMAPFDNIILIDDDLHSYIPYHIFHPDNIHNNAHSPRNFCATTVLSNTPTKLTWSEKKKIVDKVHRHICGHSTFKDIKILLGRNQLWDDDVKKYLISILVTCPHCKKTSEPTQSRKVSLSSMSRESNNTICIDHFFLEDFKIFHVMDSSTRYSAGMVVSDLTLQEACSALDVIWFSPFWLPQKILFDPAFNNLDFTSFASNLDINVGPLPPRRHNKNVIESKHRIIRDIFIRLRSDNEENTKVNTKLLVQQAIRISNDLYGNNHASAHELAKHCMVTI